MAGHLGKNFNSKLFILLIITSTVVTDSVGNLIFAGCDKNGWKCISSKVKTDKYDLEFDCNDTSSTSISLWNFRAPKEIFGLKISNCGYLEVDLSCGNDGQPIDSLYIYNIEHLNLTSPAHSELSFLPNKFVLDTIGRIDKISTNLFKQTMDFPVQLFKCSIQGTPVNTIFFTDIGRINKIEHHAVNLKDMSWFTWHNVTIHEIEPMGMQVFMEKDKQFTIKQSHIGKIGYKGIILRAHSIFFNQTDIVEIEKFGISATVYWFDFTNSKIGIVYPKGFYLLAQNVNIMNNNFSQLEPNAFHGIGPGLLVNALVSLGRLRFTYVFSKNRILQANVGSLNPDWEAYKNVKTFLNFTLNHLPCSCAELGWINLADGLGSGLADTVSFSTRIMEKKSQNMCVDANCYLPLGVMSIMQFINGTCLNASGLKEVCNKFMNNKDFRTTILTESEKFTRNRANHMSNDLNPNNNINEVLIAEHPFPIGSVKNNIIEKKTEYLNDWEGEPEFFARRLPDGKIRRTKRGIKLPESVQETINNSSVEANVNMTNQVLKRHVRQTNISDEEEFVEEPITEEETTHTEIKLKPKDPRLGAYKVNWKMIAKGSRHKESMVFVPKIIAEPSGDPEDYFVTEVSKNENSPIPITIRPFGSEEIKRADGKVSIHEQISNIAEKLTKDIEQQVQERQMLEAEEEEESAAASENLNLQDMYETKKFNPEIYRYQQNTKVTQSHNKERKRDRKISFSKSHKHKHTTKATTNGKMNDQEIDWNPMKKLEENNNESLIYKELIQVKQKLEKQYNNQTFPIPLVRKTRV